MGDGTNITKGSGGGGDCGEDDEGGSGDDGGGDDEGGSGGDCGEGADISECCVFWNRFGGSSMCGLPYALAFAP